MPACLLGWQTRMHVLVKIGMAAFAVLGSGL